MRILGLSEFERGRRALDLNWNSQVAIVVKNLPADAGDGKDTGSIPRSGRSPEKDMATHSSVLAWRIPGTAGPGGLPSMGSHRVGHDWSDLAAADLSHGHRLCARHNSRYRKYKSEQDKWVQFSSVAQSCLTLCNPVNCSTPGLPVHHQLPESAQTHVHWVCDAIQPSHPLSSPFPPAPNPSQHQSLFQWVNSSHEVAKVLEFQL